MLDKTMENKISLSLDIVNAVLNYLGSQPYAQVYPLIAAIQKEAEGQVSAAAPTAEAPAE
jgi:hypothetical protein